MWHDQEKGASLLVGYATDSGEGTRMLPSEILVITKYAEDPDRCFEVLKSLFSVKYTRSLDPLFALRTQEEEAAEKVEGVPLKELMGGDYFARMNDLFDRGGQRMIDYVPSAIWDIVKEEISAYLGGLGTAEDCAKKIQSRAEIWVAEHE